LTATTEKGRQFEGKKEKKCIPERICATWKKSCGRLRSRLQSIPWYDRHFCFCVLCFFLWTL